MINEAINRLDKAISDAWLHAQQSGGRSEKRQAERLVTHAKEVVSRLHWHLARFNETARRQYLQDIADEFPRLRILMAYAVEVAPCCSGAIQYRNSIRAAMRNLKRELGAKGVAVVPAGQTKFVPPPQWFNEYKPALAGTGF